MERIIWNAAAADAESPLDAAKLQRLAAALSDQFAALYEARPVDPRAHMAGNMLTLTFQGGLSRSDEKHLEAGHVEEIRAFRERFLAVVAEDLKGVVAAITGGTVTFFSGLFDPATRTTNMLFVLDLLPDDRGEQRAAIRNWSEQVRRNARELRLDHLQTRETHLALRQQMQDARLARQEADGDAVEDAEDGSGEG